MLTGHMSDMLLGHSPGQAPEEFDAFDSDDEERKASIEDKHHAISDCSSNANP